MKTQGGIGRGSIGNWDYDSRLSHARKKRRIDLATLPGKPVTLFRTRLVAAVLLLSLATRQPARGTPAVFTWNSATTGTTWLNSANWTGGPVNKAPGIDNNATSTIDNDPNDTATFGTIVFSGSSLAINFNTSANSGVGNNSAANGLLSLGAINFSSTSKAITIGNSSTVASGALQLNGATLNPGPGNINNVLVAISDVASQNLTIADLAGGSGVTMDLRLGITAGNFYVAPSRTLTVSDRITELNPNSGFTKLGAGTMLISGTNTYSGSTTLSAGQLTIGNDTTTLGNGAGTLVLAGGTLFRAAQTTPQVFSNPISVTDNSTISGDPSTGTRSVIFSSGTITTSAGKTLTIRNVGVAGSVFEMRLTGGGFNWSGPIAIGTGPDAGGAQLAPRSDSTGADQTFSGLISGPGRIVRGLSTANPGGNTLLGNGANSYSGGTEIRAGFIGLGTDNPLGTGAVTIGWDPNPLGLYASGGSRSLTNALTVDLLPAGGTNLQIRGSQPLTLSGPIAIHTNLQFFTISNTALTTFAGVITNAGSTAAGIVKQGLGTLKIAGAAANTYSGSTTVSKGALQLGNSSGNAVPSPSLVISNGATLQLAGDEQIANTTVVTLNAGGTFDLNGKTETIETIQSSVAEKNVNAVTTGSISLGAGTLLMNPGASGSYNIGSGISGFFGNISGPAGSKLQLASTATGEYRLLKNGNTFEQLVVNGGTFQAGHIVGQDGESIFGAVPASLKPDAIVLGNGGRIGASFSVSLHPNRGITLNAGGGVLRTDAGSMTVAGPITGIGGLIKNTSGTLTLQAANDFTGGVTISSGALTVAASGLLEASTGSVIVNGGQLNLNNPAQTIGSLSGSAGTISLASGHTLTVNQSTDTSYGGIIQNAGTLVKAGIGKLTLTGIETFFGDTIINTGTLALSGFGSISGCPNVNVNAGATLDVTGVNDGAYTFQTGQTLKGNGGINGTVVIAPGASLSPGNSIGTLYFTNGPNLQGFTVMEINKTGLAETSDKLVVVGNPLTYGGILQVSLATGSDPLVGGETFDLFDASEFDGFFFSADLPALAPDLNWWTDKLLVDGTLVVNRAPTALDKTYTRNKGTTLKVAKSDLLLGAGDPDASNGDGVAYDVLADAGLQGATVTEDNRYIYYESANDNSDTLQYRLKDMRGGHVTRNIQINVISEAGLAQGVSVNAGVATVRFAGIPAFNYQIERSTNLEDWVVLQTTNVPDAGVFEYEDHFTDLGSTPASAYYRLRN